jgi:hypothetical protein
MFWSITFANLIWILYALTEGVRESFFIHYKKQCKRCDGYRFDTIFNFQRLLVLIVTSAILIYSLKIWAIPYIVGQIFMFNFFHKIAFDQTCKKIGEDHIHAGMKKIEFLNKPLIVLGITLQIFVYIFLI